MLTPNSSLTRPTLRRSACDDPGVWGWASFVAAVLFFGAPALLFAGVLEPTRAIASSTSPAPSIYVETIGGDGEVLQRRDVGQLLFNDGTTLDCAALFVTPPARPLGSGVRSISFEVPGGLRIVFDQLAQP